MKSRAKKSTKPKAEPKAKEARPVFEDAPTNALEDGRIAPPRASRTPFSTMTGIPKGWTKASDALDYVRAVSTIFPDFDRATRCGGVPLRRIITVHGPTHGGKSAFIAGLLRSFVDAGHMGGYVDAEHATDLSFLDELFERRTETIPNFLGMRPTSYEDTVDAADEFLKWMVAERKARFGKYGKAPIPAHENLAGFLVIDSLNKLTPEKEMERLKKDGGEALDKGLGRQRANMNQAWLDHIVPLLGPAETALGLIVQERDADDLDPWEMPTLKGGKASQYDASLLVRVMKSSEVKRGEKEDKVCYGFKHKLRIWKSKVGHMDGRWSDAAFHMSNGVLVRAGFDTARDTLEVAKDLGIVAVAGSWLSWGKKRWQGEHNAVAALTKNPEHMHELLALVQARIAPKEIA